MSGRTGRDKRRPDRRRAGGPRLASASLAAGALAAGALTAVLTTAGPAQAASAITAQASSPVSSVGDLSISLITADADDITSFTAHILTARGTDVLDLPESDFALASGGTEADGTWTIHAAITTSQLLLGTYRVTVDAADAGGGSVTGAAAGQLEFLIQPTVTLAATPPALSYGASSTTLTGTVTGLMPDGSTAPLTAQPVQVTDSSNQSQTTQTDSSGSFSLTENSASTFTASVQGSTLAAARSSVTVTAATAATALTATVSEAQATFGQQVTVSGTLSYQPGASMVALPGVSVVVLAPGYPDLSVPVTANDGSFSATFSATESGQVQVYFNDPQYEQGGSYPYLAEARYAANLSVWLPTSLTQFSAAVAPSGTVSVKGCLGVTDIAASSAFSVAGTITIEYAASQSGPWLNLGTITQTTPGAGATCGVTTAEASFTGAFAARLPRAYYRASFTPESGINWLPSVSSPVLASKYLTDIRALKVSPAKLAKGGKLRVSGQLLQDKTRWIPLRGQLVEIIFRKPNTTRWYYVVKVKTNSSGRFAATVKDTFTAVWSAYYPGGRSYFSTAPPGVRVIVT